jgi:hypothetical protein
MRVRIAGAFLLLGLLAACNDPKPLGPDATPAELAAACDAMDLDACSRAAHLRDSQYQETFSINK